MNGTSSSLGEARRANIERLWPRFGWDGWGRSRWAGWDWNQCLFIVITGLLWSTTILETALWKNGEKEPSWPYELLADSPAGLSVLALLILTGGWLADRSLADRTLGESLVPGWLRWLRRALVSVPILGLYTIPLWRWIVQTRPSWAFRTSEQTLLNLSMSSSETTPSPLRAWSDSLRRKQGQSFVPFLLWMIGGQILPWVALLSWITTCEALSPTRRAILVGVIVLCHLLAGAFGFQYAVIRGRQIRSNSWKKTVLRFAPISFLAPFPFFFLGLILWVASAGEEVETLTSRKHTNKTRSSLPISLAAGSRFIRLPARAKRKLDSTFARLSAETLENSALKSRQLGFYQLKAFLLFFDAAALAWIPGLLGDGLIFRMEDSPWLQIAPFLCLAALGMVVELSFLALRVAGWFLHRKVLYQPYGRSAAITQLALTAGLLFGTLLAAGEPLIAGQLLIALGLGAAVVSTMILAPIGFVLELPGRNPYFTLAWAVLFIALAFTGGVMAGQPQLTPLIRRVFEIIMVLAPLLSVALFFNLKGWLLHPFKLGHLFDRRLPGKVRAALASVVLTAALPLGGIAVPFWIYAHHRLWPGYEKLLWKLKSS